MIDQHNWTVDGDNGIPSITQPIWPGTTASTCAKLRHMNEVNSEAIWDSKLRPKSVSDNLVVLRRACELKLFVTFERATFDKRREKRNNIQPNEPI